jgi:hypothetical protein
MSSYEVFAGYPDPTDSDTGLLKNWGFFGYPSSMLDRAIRLDDIPAFRFYWDRYFSGGHEVFGTSETIDEYCERNGGKKIAAALRLKDAMS